MSSSVQAVSFRYDAYTHYATTHEALPEPRRTLLALILSALHLRPPLLELMQPVESRELAQQLHRDNGPDPGQAVRVVAPEEVRKADELVAVEAELAFEVWGEVALDRLGLVEHVLEDASAPKEKDVRVVRDDPVDEPEREQRRALRLSLHRRGDVRDAE